MKGTREPLPAFPAISGLGEPIGARAGAAAFGPPTPWAYSAATVSGSSPASGAGAGLGVGMVPRGASESVPAAPAGVGAGRDDGPRGRCGRGGLAYLLVRPLDFPRSRSL